MTDRVVSRVYCPRRRGAHVLAKVYGDRVEVRNVVMTARGTVGDWKSFPASELEAEEWTSLSTSATCACGVVYTLDLVRLLRGEHSGPRAERWDELDDRWRNRRRG